MRQATLWQPTYSVGVRDFDQAHREMVDLAESLIGTMRRGKAQVRQRDLMDDLVECAVAHFEEEERTLHELDWPGLAAHVREHNLLLRTLLKFKADLRYHRLEPEEAAEFISGWVLTHIREEDSKYRDYLHARGVR